MSHPHIDVVPVRTPTLPPATHTNTWLLGEDVLTIVDPASPYDDEQGRLFADLQSRVDRGARIERLFLTHHHHDHVAGATDLKARLAAVGVDVPIAAHPVTAELLAGDVPIDEAVLDDQVMDCGGHLFRALHTPGHAPGHLVLLDENTGAAIAGDLVAGIGTIAIDPREGDLGDYLASLERVRGLGPSALMPAHGPTLTEADAVLAFYVAHRHSRSEQIVDALGTHGAATPLELAPRVYPDLPEIHHVLAAAQILTHLRWLAEHGLARDDGTRWSKL